MHAENGTFWLKSSNFDLGIEFHNDRASIKSFLLLLWNKAAICRDTVELEQYWNPIVTTEWLS